MGARQPFRIALAIATFALTAAVPPKHEPQPDFACKIEHRGDFGLIQADFQIMDSGESIAPYLKWEADDGQAKNLWISAAFYRRPDGSYSLDHGYISIMRHIRDRRPGKRPKPLTLSLELTTNPAFVFGSVRMASKPERSGGPFHLALDWLDAAALARGSTGLYLVARNSRREAVDKVTIDRTVFDRAEPHIVTAFTELGRMTARPAASCTHADDLGTDDIVIT